MTEGGVRWGILGTANIARASFLPGLRAAGGRPYAVAGRDEARTAAWAADNQIDHALTGYEALLDDPRVEAVYVPLPNSLHLAWAVRALEAGKPVLCEKPLGLDAAQVETMTAASVRTGVPLWEAFVFMFRPHFATMSGWVRDGAIGTIREIDSRFGFRLRHSENIRLRPELGGGALYDVGCYPVHFASLLFGGAGESAAVLVTRHAGGVDETVSGSVAFGTGRLLFSASLNAPSDTFTRIVGDDGSITVTNPFHPGDRDQITLTRDREGETTTVSAGDGLPSFAAHIAHIGRVARGEEAPRLTALETSAATAVTIDRIRQAGGLG